MTPTLLDALRALEVVRSGTVVRGWDGEPLSDRQAQTTMRRILRRAGLEACERGWHRLRHTFGTHAAMLDVNPWRLQAWMGHKSITTTEKYVHVAEVHARPLPPAIVAVDRLCEHADGDRRVVLRLGARRGSEVAASGPSRRQAGDNA